MDMADLFNITAPPVRDTFVADPVTVIKDKIRNDFIAPNAIDTPDATTITPLWARCSFTISAGHRHSNRRLTLANLREAMQCAIAYSVTHELKITLGIQALHFRPGLNYLQWGIDITDSATGFAAPAATAAPAPAVAAPYIGRKRCWVEQHAQSCGRWSRWSCYSDCRRRCMTHCMRNCSCNCCRNVGIGSTLHWRRQSVLTGLFSSTYPLTKRW